MDHDDELDALGCVAAAGTGAPASCPPPLADGAGAPPVAAAAVDDVVAVVVATDDTDVVDPAEWDSP